MKAKYPFLIFFLLITQAAGLLGASFTTPAIPTWYASINKPFFNPPNWIFAPVWTILYILMAIAAYYISISKVAKRIKRQALIYYFIQLVLNSLWSMVFFGLRNPLLGFLIILILWTMIFLTMLKFLKIKNISFYLMLPYISWVSFAAVLNFSIVILN